MNNSANYRTTKTPTWCPGCGNYLLLTALQQALAEKQIPSHQLVVVYDIGCAGNMADFLRSYAVHALHGRIIPLAMGIKYFRPRLTVICVGGDGGVYGEGLNHLITATRANIDIKVFVSNNQLYSLTTGQASPTTPKGASTKSTPFGVDLEPLPAVKLVREINRKVWAETITSQKLSGLVGKIKEALEFKGFSLLEIQQNCLAFGKLLKQG